MPIPPAGWGKWEKPGGEALGFAPSRSSCSLEGFGMKRRIACVCLPTHHVHPHLRSGPSPEDAPLQGFGVGSRFMATRPLPFGSLGEVSAQLSCSGHGGCWGPWGDGGGWGSRVPPDHGPTPRPCKGEPSQGVHWAPEKP